ncbi:hypothetical protein WS67_00255 [Burkholderia singularis]|uniref:Uncharacterized protein n=1 Tax=Burkholderia singularis TaxID=1503053 RepID=A0A103E7A0_9BURK|nr:hypothetical protein WS67_00255 [Burkholderia singularis]
MTGARRRGQWKGQPAIACRFDTIWPSGARAYRALNAACLFFVALSAVPRWPSMQVRAAHSRHSSTCALAGKIERRSFAATSARFQPSAFNGARHTRPAGLAARGRLRVAPAASPQPQPQRPLRQSRVCAC